MKKITVHIDQLVQYPYHEKLYGKPSSGFLKVSIKRTGNKPVYDIVVIPVPNNPRLFHVISGMSRLYSLIGLGETEIEVIVYDLVDENEIKNLIVDLNKQRIKTGKELYHEFIHHIELYPGQKGKKGNSRYSKIGKELGMNKHKVKDLVMLYDFFNGEGDCILEMIFEKELSINQGSKLKKVVEEFEDKFDSEGVFKKFCNKKYDFNRLEYSIKNLDPRINLEFDIIESYLLKDLTPQEFHKKLEQLGKVEGRVQKHNDSKVNVPEIDENYKSKHVHLINDDNRKVEFHNPFGKPINCIVGSPPYGNLRLNSDDPENETGHNMTGHEYGVYLSETYSKYKEYMDPSGSIYIIINDYRNENGSFSLSLEHLVVEMERKGYYLVGRYIWWKNNPQPRSYNVKNMTNGFEMVYRFSPNPEQCYFNPDLFLELDEREKRLSQGCTNTDNRGNTTRGTSYVQSHLKKVRDTLDEQICMDVILGNVANPEDFFRQVEEKRHTSTSPIYLTSTLILESTKPNDLVVDIWGGVGNTMVSSLLLGRDYIGIEKEENYFKQSQRRLQMTEQMIQDISVVSDDDELRMLPAA